jgi:hypothetical protein
MIGQRIETPAQFPVLGVLFLLGAASLVLLALALNNVHYAIGALLPGLVGLARCATARPAFAAVFTDRSIEEERPRHTVIAYDSLQGLKGKGRSTDLTKRGPRFFPILVLHESGVLEIPARLNVPSDKVFLFLYEQFPPDGTREFRGVLREHLEEQQRAFGPDRVWAYRAREHLGAWGTYRRAWATSLAVFATGVGWAALGFSLNFPVWAGWGVMLALFGLLFFVVFRSSGRPRGVVKNWRRAGLIISPVGLALVQGDVQGEMRWDELRDVQFRPRQSSFTLTGASAMAGIVLRFEGASVIIADIYDRPLREIFERIRAYWK